MTAIIDEALFINDLVALEDRFEEVARSDEMPVHEKVFVMNICLDEMFQLAQDEAKNNNERSISFVNEMLRFATEPSRGMAKSSMQAAFMTAQATPTLHYARMEKRLEELERDLLKLEKRMRFGMGYTQPNGHDY